MDCKQLKLEIKDKLVKLPVWLKTAILMMVVFCGPVAWVAALVAYIYLFHWD